MRGLAIALVLLAGCSEDNKPSVDAAPGVQDAVADAPAAATVVTVDCAGVTPAATVMTSNFAFTPGVVTITVNAVVRFAPESVHNVVPGAAPTDPGLRSGALGEARCLRFTTAGTFNYRCQPHPNMTGTITVN
ncbi:MAG: plastocyanin/azurin family copper-binding protein [Myxococcota bacterium]|nr:plastocyanin/azurin family copper-binding protein [Myxococcota bacterium]